MECDNFIYFFANNSFFINLFCNFADVNKPTRGSGDRLSLRVGCLQDIFIYKASYNALTWLFGIW